jgi:hypothetical protein
MGVAATSPDDDDEFEVIMGCPCLQTPDPTSLPAALDMAHVVLRQVQHVFYQEWNELGAEQQHLKEWGSLLRVHTRSEKQKAAMKRAQLDAMEEVLKEE